MDAEGREVRWISIPSPTEGFYLRQVSWAGNSEELLAERFSRFRNERDFFIAAVTTGEVNRIHHGSDPAWVIASYRLNAGLEWIPWGDSFLFLTEKDGWRHSCVHGEPHAQTVLDRWSARNIRHRAIADLGYLVVSIENRGTPAPKGAARAAGALTDDRRAVDGGARGGSPRDGPDAPLRRSVQSGDLAGRG